MTKRANLFILMLFSLVALATLLWVMLNRFSFGYDLEWMEGGMLMHAVRLAEGRGIYVPPTSEFVPYFYTPGYPTIVAVLGKVFGISYALARSISIASTLGTMLLIFLSVKREASWPYGIIAMGVYAALFRTNGAFYDLARPDSLFLVLVLAAMFLTRYGQGVRVACIAGALCALSFLTKQTASVFFVAICVVHFWRSWRDGLMCLTFGAGLSIVGCFILNKWSDGWFWTYVFEGHQGHVFIWNNILFEYWRDLLFLAPVLLLVPLIQFWKQTPVKLAAIVLVLHWSYAFYLRATTLDYVPHMYYRELWYEEPRYAILLLPAFAALLVAATLWRLRRRPFTPSWVWLWFFVAGCGVSGLNHSTQWAYANCFMPISITAAILIGITIKNVFEQTDRFGSGCLTLLLVLQFVGVYYTPHKQVPSSDDQRALTAFETRMAKREGNSMVLTNPFLAHRSSKTFHTHRMGLQDVAYLGGVKDLSTLIRRQHFSTIAVGEGDQIPGLQRSYYEGPQLHLPTTESLRMKTGYLTRVRQLWYARSDGERSLAKGVTGTFEGSDDIAGWHFSGKAFEGNSGRVRYGGLGGQGRYVLRSDKPTKGRASTQFDGRQNIGINFLIGGACQDCYVELRDKDSLVGTLRAPRRRGPLKRVHLRIPRGRKPLSQVRIVVVDNDTKGAIIVDDFRLESIESTGSGEPQ